jgi:hypothetical protein
MYTSLYALSNITVIKSRDVASTQKKRGVQKSLLLEGEEKIFERRRHSGGNNFKTRVKEVGYSVWTKFCWLEKGIRGGF